MKNTEKKISALLQSKRKNLIKNFIKGEEESLLESNAMLLDDYFQESFGKSKAGMEMSVIKYPFAIVALGGYGRKEQCIYSDVDIVFLFKKKVPLEAEKLVQEIIYPLWDIGLDVGHCTRSIPESLKLAKENYETFTSLLDSRFLCGMSKLYSELNDRLKIKVIRPKTKKIIAEFTKEMKQRHARLGDSSYLLEPNIKEGKGGLRDYHNMLWASRVLYDLRTPEDFVYSGILSSDEYRNLSTALSFIFSVRNRLHYLAGRKCDQLYFEYQTALAKDMKFKKEKGQMPVERFLSRLHGEMEVIKQYSTVLFYEVGEIHQKKIKERKLKKKPKDDRIVVLRSMLNFKSSEDVFRSPILLMRIFEESARLGKPISAESRRIIKEFLSLVDTDVLRSKQMLSAFEYILLTPAPTFNVLNEMLNTGMLSKFIPEFSKIENRVQFDEYHLYPVDKHSLRTVQIIKSFSDQKIEEKNRLYGKIYKELSNNLKLLMWAGLLHDIGKGKEDERHSISGSKAVKKILKRIGYDAEAIDTVGFLVKEHLFLSKIATRRDISDEETAIFCARKINNAERLKMLYLLSVADAMATGPKAWSEWFSSLLRDLFLKVLSILEKGELATEEAIDSIEKKKLNVKKSSENTIGKKELEFVVENMSPRYLLYTDKEEILKHVELYGKLGQKEFVWNVEQSEKEDVRTLTFCGKDHPGLFSKIAGVFTFNDLDILDAQVFTWKNNIALDILKVKPPPDKIYEDEVWTAAEKNLKAAISGELDLECALKEKIESYQLDLSPTAQRPHRVKMDNKSSSFYSIIEVFTYDYKGLLFRLTDALYKNNLDIWVAKIATKADQVVDVFYVRNVNGEKIDNDDEVQNIIISIQLVLKKISKNR
ncbi:MAG: [protein-PII] uridylyltransferase, partial [Deltaproteobacteria bacterium]|nr:[protein-PII] uridylyltransferase [Deltaproteobacteria bacterium]